MSTDNIHTAIAAVYKDVGYVQKERKQGLNYSFAGEAALIEALRPSMVEHGITVAVVGISDIHRELQATKSGGTMQYTTLLATVRFTHAPSASYIDVMSVGEGADVGDKSTNKAMTGAFKYALRQTFCIETGDDPDSTPSPQQERARPGLAEAARALGAVPVEREVPPPATNAKDFWEELQAVMKAEKIPSKVIHSYLGAFSRNAVYEWLEKEVGPDGRPRTIRQLVELANAGVA